MKSAIDPCLSGVEFLETLLKSCDRFEWVDELAGFCPVKVGGIDS